MMESLIMRFCHHCEGNQRYHLYLNLSQHGEDRSLNLSFALVEERSFGIILKICLDRYV